LVNSLLVSGGDVYAGGAFTAIGGSARNRLASVSASGAGTATAWNPNANGQVNVLALGSSGTIYAGGLFTNVAGVPAEGVVCLIPNELVAVPAIQPTADLEFAIPRPNPTRGLTVLELALPQSAHARVSIYDLQGRLVARPLDADRPAGRHRLLWHSGVHGPGIYFVSMEALGRTLTRRLVVVR